MKRFGIVALFTASILGVAGCSTNDAKVDACGKLAGSNCEKTIQYKGKPLDCIVWTGSAGEVGMTCDFVKYHAEND